MNIKELHTEDKEVSALSLFKGETGTTVSIKLKKEGILKEHSTKIPALLLCISGVAQYEDENKFTSELRTGDMVNIQANIKHWLMAKEESFLILMK